MDKNDQIDSLQIRLAHAERTIEELSDELARLNKRMAQQEQALNYLLQRAQADADSTSHQFSDPPPPHY